MFFCITAVAKYFPYPKLQLVLTLAGAMLVKNKMILTQGIGTTEDVDTDTRSLAILLRGVVEDLKSTKGTDLDNIYNSVFYLKNLCQREIL